MVKGSDFRWAVNTIVSAASHLVWFFLFCQLFSMAYSLAWISDSDNLMILSLTYDRIHSTLIGPTEWEMQMREARFYNGAISHYKSNMSTVLIIGSVQLFCVAAGLVLLCLGNNLQRIAGNVCVRIMVFTGIAWLVFFFCTGVVVHGHMTSS